MLMSESFRNILISTSTILALSGYLLYLISILRGKAKPHRTTRLIIFIISSITTASLYAQGNRVAIWLSGVFAISSLVIFILSLKHGLGGFSKLDISCFVIALIGTGLWIYTKNPIIALIASIIADFTGYIPTIIKSYKLPSSEVWYFFFIGALSALVNLLATKNWNIISFIYPAYIITVNLTVTLLVLKPYFVQILKAKK